MSERYAAITILNTLDRPLELVNPKITAAEASSFPGRIEAGGRGDYIVTSPKVQTSRMEVSFTLRDIPPQGEPMLGTCSLNWCIPLFSGNTSGISLTGAVGQTGYAPINSHGYQWTCTITLFSKLDVNGGDGGGYSWDAISALQELSDEEVDIQSAVPDKYVFSDRMFGRSGILEIPKKYWADIKDPLFPDEYGQRQFVARYFSVAAYRIKRSTSVAIAANQSYSKETTIHHRSSTRTEKSQELNLENTLRLEREGISGELRSAYRISQMSEYCDESEKDETERLEYSAVEYDRDVVIWDLDKVVCVFRENIKGKTGLIGRSDYYVSSTAKTYAKQESEDTIMLNSDKTIEQRLAFLDALELPDLPETPAGESKGTAAVDAGQLVTFSKDVPKRGQADVLNSCLLAQLAATKKYDREKQPEEWYRFYSDVLSNVGWVMDRFQFQKYQSSSTSFGIDTFMLNLLQSIATGSMGSLMTSAINFMKSLSKTDPRAMLFDSSTRSGKQGNFQLGACYIQSGVLTMGLGCSYFSASSAADSFFFLHFESSDSEAYFSTQDVQLNMDVYDQVRDEIIDKLGDRAHRYVADLEI